MNVLVLLGVVALLSCALGVARIARIGKARRSSLKSYERACLQLSEEPPRSMPQLRAQQQRQQHDGAASAALKRSLAFVSESARATLLAALISPLLAPLVSGVEHAPSTPPSNPHAPQEAKGIWKFVRQQPLVLAALRLSGLSLLMANQHDAPLQAAVVRMNPSATEQAECDNKSLKSDMPLTSQTTWSEDDDEVDEYDDDSFEDEEDSDSTPQDDDELFKDACEQESSDDIAAESDAQRVLFDGLQFYTVLSQVGATVVRSVVQQALQNTLESIAIQRVQEKQQASISAIEQWYPDIVCLSAPSYMQHTRRTDLATALFAVTAAAAAIQQQQQQQQHTEQQCSTMERRLSAKRPESLALAAEDGMEPMRRTPLTSPSTASGTQFETSFLQAA